VSEQFVLFESPAPQPEGLRYAADFVSPETEQRLISGIRDLSLQPFQFRQFEGKRRAVGLDCKAVREIIHSEERLQSSVGGTKINPLSLEPLSAHSICSLSNTGLEVDTMRKILLATVAILAFTAPSFAQQDKTTGQAPPSGASSFYIAQDTATMKCHVVNAQPAAGGSTKVIGTAHPTMASAQTALAADKTCKE
jgi:hypothetical protein